MQNLWLTAARCYATRLSVKTKVCTVRSGLWVTGRRAERILRRICVNNITISPENQERKSSLRLSPRRKKMKTPAFIGKNGVYRRIKSPKGLK